MKTDIRVLIADDHPVFRAGLKQTVEAEPRFTVVGDAADGQTALRLIEELKPAVSILDINMPALDGLEVARVIRQRRLPGEIIFLTMHSEEEMFNQALSLGVKGYVLKDSVVTDIINCLNAVSAGQSYTSPAITSYLFKRAARQRDAATQLPGLNSLTPTERNILRL